MKILRFLIVILILGYAGWLIWPVVSPFLEGAAPSVAANRAGAEVTTDGIPTAILWVGAGALYIIAALLLGSGNPRAALAYLLGFAADAALRLAIDRGGASGPADINARSADMAAPMTTGGVDPTWLILGALVVVGVLVFVASRRIRRVRTPGRLAV
ncbi:hypothetical protein ASG17_03205 [Brevundimonas sp. Leaf363]|uniref:hypothetical protein n=1 Tax=Brevundimonas sp. Leaf363 TaxID=1736353 RepID=UPI0006F3F70C|nr:hypothetical protein [Brevundimonas sp. Leaf363]KQS55121.1 hypothetical protein ASG17_03205 [Brevundimonas sp. Leaf363]